MIVTGDQVWTVCRVPTLPVPVGPQSPKSETVHYVMLLMAMLLMFINNITVTSS